ncbi:MAG: hypothetical protein N3G20_07165, partial [Verrucomicrobiae bacterium]|nr:hypothetical protein [Verrucomicrobiae bacterium]
MQSHLHGTAHLDFEGDPAKEMVSGMDRYLDRFLAETRSVREEMWRDYFFGAAGKLSNELAETNRALLRTLLGMVDQLNPVSMTIQS